MADLTLEQLNGALSKAQVSEMSRERVYLLVFDQRGVSQATALDVVRALGRMGIKSVSVFKAAGEPVKVFTLEPKEVKP